MHRIGRPTGYDRGADLTACSTIITNASSTPNPYASVVEPTVPVTPCLVLPNPPTNIPQGYYCNGINFLERQPLREARTT